MTTVTVDFSPIGWAIMIGLIFLGISVCFAASRVAMSLERMIPRTMSHVVGQLPKGWVYAPKSEEASNDPA